MMKRLWVVLIALLVFGGTRGYAQESYRLQEIAEGVYAALALPGGRATSNAIIVVTYDWVLAGGAHMTRDAVTDLLEAVTEITPRPVNYFVLPHHHRGFAFTDFDFPPNMQVLMSGQTWAGLQSEVPAVIYPVLFFSEGLTLKSSRHTVVLSNLGRGHAEGDVIVYLPESNILFSSDLLYSQSIGFLGDGHMEDWVLALEFIQQLAPEKIVPGYGPVSEVSEVEKFKNFLKAFLSQVLLQIEAGKPLEQVKKEFRLPRYEEIPGYSQFLDVNLERAYHDLQQGVLNR